LTRALPAFLKHSDPKPLDQSHRSAISEDEAMTNRVHSQGGSTYIVVLLVLFVLTSLGLALTFVTQNEIVIGSQERTTQRAFYAADSGLNIAIADALRGDYAPKEIEIENPDGLFGSDLVDRVETSPFWMVNYGFCDLCQVNDDSTAKQYYKINHAVTSRGLRIAQGSSESENVPVARREVTVMVELQPVELREQAELDTTNVTITL
jgi:hypothetical protein